ncbi:MAG TPA: hypothetical protein VH187_13660 [Scandinavium sp.]|jgi:hypothetical protein|uniref:hypothetical protein n=1 Tax=Scandinavium sp. TaxID=2830653 RepID=UPI002E33D346|nr:hypothetical protein [Scandinavium sp.]HEX4502178.1 hypothetical protein [Scandinavium sp.]
MKGLRKAWVEPLGSSGYRRLSVVAEPTSGHPRLTEIGHIDYGLNDSGTDWAVAVWEIHGRYDVHTFAEAVAFVEQHIDVKLEIPKDLGFPWNATPDELQRRLAKSIAALPEDVRQRIIAKQLAALELIPEDEF